MKFETEAGQTGIRPTRLAARREALRRMIRAQGLDCLLVFKAPNRFYLSGFELHDPQPGESAGCVLIGADGEDWLATDSRYEEAAKKIWPEDHLFIYGADMASGLRNLTGLHANLAGIEGKAVEHEFFMRLTPARKRDAKLLCVDGLVEKLRMIKDEEEIACLRRSFALNHRLLAWLEDRLSPPLRPVSETELAWEVERFFRENGAQELAFSSILATAENGALPHAVPQNIPVREDAPFLADVGCRVDNYCSDQTRTFWLGSAPTPEFTRAMQLVREAQQAAIDLIRPGTPCAAVDARAREVFEQAGAASHFNHSLGHGVGLETHEGPRLSPSSDAILEKNMVVTVEPGLYYPEWGGVRWEYTVLVGENGAEIL